MSRDWVLFDARCLQDPSYRHRGVGQHARCIVESGRAAMENFRFVAFADAAGEALGEEFQPLFDGVVTALPASLDRLAHFVQLSPMTHLVQPVLRILNRPAIHKTAVVYDFIQLLYPERYFGKLTERMKFAANLCALQNFDHYACISSYTSHDLERQVPGALRRSSVSGVAVRGPLMPAAGEAPFEHAARRHVLVAGGGDARKNPECALLAHARSRLLQDMQVPVLVTGNYPSSQRNPLKALYAREGGLSSLLRFADQLSDAELRDAYRYAHVTVVPSYAEGFSIPVVEALASGCPVLVSDATAHIELVADRGQRFSPDDPDELRAKLEAIVGDAQAWRAALSAQSRILREYTPQRVGERFWSAVRTSAQQSGNSRAAVGNFSIGGARPRVAVVATWPPAVSGVADHTAAICREFGKLADVEVFTATVNGTAVENVAAIHPVSAQPYVSSRFDATLSVIGNSHHALEAFLYVLDYGGAAIVHDARLIDFYFLRFGIARTLAVASREAKRDVTLDELRDWLRDQSRLPVLFLSEIAARADPLFVHSGITANLMSNLYSRTPVVLPFAQYSDIRPEAINRTAMLAARADLNVPEDEALIVSFGIASIDKAPLDCVRAVSLLKSRGRNVRLVFCGYASPPVRGAIERETENCGLGGRVVVFSSSVSKTDYSRYLLAADASIQLRTYLLGGLSGALNDCIAAAVPAVANAHLAEAMNAPEFVVRIPDQFDAHAIAGGLEAIFDGYPERPVGAALKHAAETSTARYAQLLFERLFEPGAGR
jgi:glycosyltransferase involved in cell wall biosynthesis